MSKLKGIQKVLIIGSGPIVIGQACEFDYSGTQACKALRSMGYKIVLVNSNCSVSINRAQTQMIRSLLSFRLGFFKSRTQLQLEIVFLRKQLEILIRWFMMEFWLGWTFEEGQAFETSVT